MGGGVAKARAAAEKGTASIAVGVYNGARRPLEGTSILIRLRDGRQRELISKFYERPGVRFLNLQPADNFVDNYSVLVSPKGYSDGGYFPVKIEDGAERKVSLLCIPKVNALNFARATWNQLNGQSPSLKSVLLSGAPDDEAAALRYMDLLEYKSGEVTACLLNLLTALSQTAVDGGSALTYMREIIWDRTGRYALDCDRLFGWADSSLVAHLESAVQAGKLTPAPANLHPGATRSYKQTLFSEANLQITLHENDRKQIGGTQCLMIEPDIDYFRDPAAHFFGEVLVNAFGSMTDPRQVLALRWTAGRQAGLPDFDPLYTVEKA